MRNMLQHSLSNWIFNFLLHPQISSKMKLCYFIKLSRCHLRGKKRENNFSIISDVSFTSDITTLKYFLYKNFYLFPMSSQPMNHSFPFLRGQIPQKILYTFLYYVHSFLIMIFLSLSVCFNFFSKSIDLFSIFSNFFEICYTRSIHPC